MRHRSRTALSPHFTSHPPFFSLFQLFLFHSHVAYAVLSVYFSSSSAMLWGTDYHFPIPMVHIGACRSCDCLMFPPPWDIPWCIQFSHTSLYILIHHSLSRGADVHLYRHIFSLHSTGFSVVLGACSQVCYSSVFCPLTNGRRLSFFAPISGVVSFSPRIYSDSPNYRIRTNTSSASGP